MPELPEVEITRRSFADRIEGATVLQVRRGMPLRWPVGGEPLHWIGCRVGPVGRRGKYLIIPLLERVAGLPEGGQRPGAGLLLVHLGMSGSLRFAEDLPAPGRHDHFDLLTSQGCLRLHDPRRFGAVVWAPSLDSPQARKLLARLGPEPWDEQGQPFDAPAFHAVLRRSRAPVKQVLLAGQAVVGVGNIYASEALYLAGIHPALPANRLSAPRARRLRDAICEVLGQSLAHGGTTLRDFSNAHGEGGLFQHVARVYGCDGQPCCKCGTNIRKIVQGQRSTYFCTTCQRR